MTPWWRRVGFVALMVAVVLLLNHVVYPALGFLAWVPAGPGGRARGVRGRLAAAPRRGPPDCARGSRERPALGSPTLKAAFALESVSWQRDVIGGHFLPSTKKAHRMPPPAELEGGVGLDLDD